MLISRQRESAERCWFHCQKKKNTYVDFTSAGDLKDALFSWETVKVTVDLQVPILSKKTFTLSEFSKKNYIKNLKHERVIHKNVNSYM